MGALKGMRIVIAGGGVVGWTTALVLADAGANVVLADPDPTGANASSVAAGMLAPVFETLFDAGSGASLELLRAARDRWPDLAARIGIPIATAGAMAVGEAAELDAWAERLALFGADWTRLDPMQAKARSAALRERWGGLHTGEDWRIEPGVGLPALRDAALSGGARLAPRSVEGFQGGRVRLSDGEVIAADRLVVATGPSRSLGAVAPELDRLTPIKGHILRTPGVPLSGPVVRFDGGYVCPSEGGAVVGATMEPGKADTDIDPAVAQRLRNLAGRALPVLAGAAVTARTGVRASSPDGLPMAGPSLNPGVWLAVGVRRNGWLLAPLVARTITDALAEAEASAWAAAFAPARFAV